MKVSKGAKIRNRYNQVPHHKFYNLEARSLHPLLRVTSQKTVFDRFYEYAKHWHLTPMYSE